MVRRRLSAMIVAALAVYCGFTAAPVAQTAPPASVACRARGLNK